MKPKPAIKWHGIFSQQFVWCERNGWAVVTKCGLFDCRIFGGNCSGHACFLPRMAQRERDLFAEVQRLQPKQ